MIALSKVMRQSDFAELAPELVVVEHTLALLGGGDKAQHLMRKWEYAMALRAFNLWNSEGEHHRLIADHGCCTGLFSPMMLSLGHMVNMYEIWAWGNQEEFAMRQVELAMGVSEWGSGCKMIHKSLEQLGEEDRTEAAYCISTIEHIPNHEEALRNMLRTVMVRGMAFLTSDFAGRGGYGFIADSVRPDGMFWRETYERMGQIGQEEGFEFLGGEPDWAWDEGCKLVNDYGFGSIALVRLT